MFRLFNALTGGPYGRADRKSRNEDGTVFWGYDDKDRGTTTWYDSDGTCDSSTETPTDED